MRLLRLLAAVALLWLPLAGSASAQVPTCLPPLIECPVPSESPTPSPTPAPSTTSPPPAPSSVPPTTEPVPQPIPTGDTGVLISDPAPAPTLTTAPPAPSVAPTTVPRAVTARISVEGTFGMVVGLLLALPLLLSFLASQRSSGGTAMSDRRSRLYVGAAFLGLAAIVGILGWFKLADEPALNRQIPYLASAGMAVVILAAIGGSMLVAEQLRTDASRIDELEEAVRSLALALSPMIEEPPRLRTTEVIEAAPARKKRA